MEKLLLLFITPHFALGFATLSFLAAGGLVFVGHVHKMDPTVATACFVGLIALVLTALFLVFATWAYQDSKKRKG